MGDVRPGKPGHAEVQCSAGGQPLLVGQWLLLQWGRCTGPGGLGWAGSCYCVDYLTCTASIVVRAG